MPDLQVGQLGITAVMTVILLAGGVATTAEVTENLGKMFWHHQKPVSTPEYAGVCPTNVLRIHVKKVVQAAVGNTAWSVTSLQCLVSSVCQPCGQLLFDVVDPYVCRPIDRRFKIPNHTTVLAWKDMVVQCLSTLPCSTSFRQLTFNCSQPTSSKRRRLSHRTTPARRSFLAHSSPFINATRTPGSRVLTDSIPSLTVLVGGIATMMALKVQPCIDNIDRLSRSKWLQQPCRYYHTS